MKINIFSTKNKNIIVKKIFLRKKLNFNFKLSKIFKNIIKYSTFIFFILINLIVNFDYINAINYINVSNTQAGYSTFINTNTDYPNTYIKYVIKKPDNSTFYISDITDEKGKSNTVIYGKNLTIAGIYSIYAIINNQKTHTTTFEVKASNISEENSKINTNKKYILANNEDNVIISIQLKDKYNNPIKNHELELITYHPQTKIINITNKTDEYGIFKSILYTNKEGEIQISIYSKTENKYLNIPIIINSISDNNFNNNYLATNITNINNNTGNDILISENNSQTSNNNNTGSNLINKSKFKFIINGPSEAEINKSITVRIRIVDDKNKILTNYKGTIRFESSDNLAILPSDFTFTEEDKGVRTFSLAIRFKTPGKQNIVVKDINNAEIEKGILEVNVKDDNPIILSKPVILSPIDKSYINKDEVELSAKVETKNKLFSFELYDKEVLLDTIQSNSNGEINKTIKNLHEGEHTFVLKYKLPTENQDTENKKNYESDPVTFYVDITAPIYYGNINLSKKEGKKNDPIDIEIISEPNLKKANIIFNDEIYELLPVGSVNNNRQKYKTTIILPNIESKSYNLKMELVDQAGNNNLFENIGTITIMPEKEPIKEIKEINYVFKCEDLIIFFEPIIGATYFQIKYDNTNEKEELSKITPNIYLNKNYQHVEYTFNKIDMSKPLFIQAIAYDYKNEIIAKSKVIEVIDNPSLYLECNTKETINKNNSDNTTNNNDIEINVETGPNIYIYSLLILTLYFLTYYIYKIIINKNNTKKR